MALKMALSRPSLCELSVNLPASASKRAAAEAERIQQGIAYVEVLLPSYGMETEEAEAQEIMDAADIEHWPVFKKKMLALSVNPWFERFFGAVITINAITMGMEVDNVGNKNVRRICEYVFAVLFTIEFGIRVTGSPIPFWRDVSIILDFPIVVISVFDNFGVLLLDLDTKNFDLSTMSVLRIMRMCRFARLFRTLSWVRPIRVIVDTMTIAFTSLIWVVLLLGLVLIVFAFLLRTFLKNAEVLGDTPEDIHAMIQEYFSSVPSTFQTLLEVMLGGMYWTDKITIPLYIQRGSTDGSINFVYVLIGIFWTFFVLLTQVLVCNIVLGMFVEALMTQADNGDEQIERERVVSQKLNLQDLARMFGQLDKTPPNHRISLREFLDGIEFVPELQEVLSLETEDLEYFFDCVDMNNSGEIEIDDFILGVIRMKAGSRSVDELSFDYMTRKILHALAPLPESFHEVEDHIDGLEQVLEENRRKAEALQSRLQPAKQAEQLKRIMDGVEILQGHILARDEAGGGIHHSLDDGGLCKWNVTPVEELMEIFTEFSEAYREVEEAEIAHSAAIAAAFESVLTPPSIANVARDSSPTAVAPTDAPSPSNVEPASAPSNVEALREVVSADEGAVACASDDLVA